MKSLSTPVVLALGLSTFAAILAASCETPANHAASGAAKDSAGGSTAARSTSASNVAGAPAAANSPDASGATNAVRAKDDTSKTDFTAFLSADRCAQCHSHSPTASALTSRTGDDVSPYGTWQATAMANSFRDPYWRAQMAHEVELAPADKAAIEGLCLTCHAPVASHTARLTHAPAPSIESTVNDPLAREGVACMVCHRATAENLGTPASFDGRLAIAGDARIYGPFENPSTGPMRMHTGFTPTHGAHVSSSALCGSCHTLTTQAHGASQPFVEQAVYLEWRNSVFSDEGGATSESRSCQSCHMPEVGTMRIARNPGGFDFAIGTRDGVRAHAVVGGNAFLIDLLRENAGELGVVAAEDALVKIARAARAMLAHETARVTIVDVKRTADHLEFDVKIENLTGHKLPSGYPSRRMWLDVDVRQGRTKLWESGDSDDAGRLKGVTDEMAIPHLDRIERTDQVAVFEMVAADVKGATTMNLTEMATRTKDNRILPRGWRADGPHAAETAPVGTAGDDDFTAGSDRVTYVVPIPPDAGDLLVVAGLYYQPIPPAWAGKFRGSKTPEAAAFLRMYEKADRTPDRIAIVTAQVPSPK